jgi:photosystem II stability/assembly factor-like uncharacterized protein
MKGLVPLLFLAAAAEAQSVDPALLGGLEYRGIGPDGNRTIAIVGEPGNDAVVYIGAASGGIWKTTDGGLNWKPVFDDVDVSSVGALAIAPSDPNVVWAGTGETFVIRPALSIGNGIYRSTDGGESWTHAGLEKTGRIGRILVHPENPDVALACAAGHAYSPQPERGVFRTEDGGKTWEKVLFVDESTGCSDLAMDATNPRILVAGMWQIQIDTAGLRSGGPGSGVHRSKDGGLTWEKLSSVGKGLPGGADHPLGKIAVAIAPSDPDRWYVLTEDTSPGFYRSNDGGDKFELVSNDHTMNERAPYYTRFAVSSDDPSRIYFASVRFSLSVDGGKTLAPDPPRGGGDNHDVWVDPKNANRILVAHDGGASISVNRGKTFQPIVLPVAQMYHVEVDDQVPYYVYGNRQDGYSYRGPSRSRTGGGGIPLGMWHGVGGCESGWATPDPVDDHVVWSGCYDGGLERYDRRNGQWRDVRVWPEAAYGWAPADVKYRWHWNFPLHISPHDHERVYVGSQHVHVTENGGQSWQVLSPDLTTNDKTRQRDSGGGLTVDNLYTFDGSVLFAIAESPVEKGVIWTGSNDGQVHVTRDSGKTWTNVSKNVPGLYVESWIKNIEPSRFGRGTAYMAVSHHQDGDFAPYIFKTSDYGASWKKVSDGIAKSVFSFVHVVREDPVRKGMLYAGTENQIWASLDDGAQWFSLRRNMPPAPIYWLTIQKRFDDLVVATYGRGFYILDDIGPLRALDASLLAAERHLFAPRPAYRFRPVQGIKTEGGSEVSGQNPRYGASIAYYLRDETKDAVEIEILDQKGEQIRKLDGTKKKGLNRVTWDLRHEKPREAKLRTPPPDKDWVPLGEEGWRRLRTWDLDIFPGYEGPLAVPGTYTVKLRVGESEFSQELEVLKDPHSTGTQADVEAQVALLLKMRDQIHEVVDMIDELEWTRKELLELVERHGAREGMKTVVANAEELEQYALSVEAKLFDVNMTGAREDAFRAPMQLYGRLGALANDVGMDGADFPPTDQQLEVHAVLTARLEEVRAQYEKLMKEDVPAFRVSFTASEEEK